MPTIRRSNAAFVVILGMLIAIVAFSGPANAAPYTTQPSISVSTQTPTIGSSLRVCGRGFHARTRVTIRLDNRTWLSAVVANSSGAFCKTVRLPDRVSGAHRIWANDAHGGIATASIRIQGPTISVNTRTPTIGSSLRVCGRGFHARTRVTITLDRRTRLSSVVATSTGTFCKTVKLPRRVGGGHTVWANDGHGRSAAAAIRIGRQGVRVAGVSLSADETTSGGTTVAGVTASEATASEATASDELAFTGGTVIGIGALGSLLLVGGGLMLLTGRRRKSVS